MTTPPPDGRAGDYMARYNAQEAGRRRLAARYGNEHERRWIADPNGPTVPADSMLAAFLHKSRTDLQTDAMRATPELEHDDLVAAAHMIRVARDEARRTEDAVMRQLIRRGLGWDVLADILGTTAEDLRTELRRRGQRPDTWPTTT